ncbi:MAG TPA: NAD-dependent malic enzyme [Vicinamibacteria bacterium]|nr:NAD-dependent malic enzyme [Vicinamibacteria bacterium]
MERYTIGWDEEGARVQVPYRGPHLLSHPMYNKSTAFTREERLAFGLDGLLPEVVSTMAQQAERVQGNIARKEDPLERYIGLAALQDRNEHLFYRVLVDHLEEYLPIVYTPTVGRVCQTYSRIFRRARGLWITPRHRGRIDEALGNAPYEEVRLIVATDNESILGLGDQGAGGMAIPIGKLALYTAAAGIHPALTLPISLDVGTDNRDLLDDDLYLGWRQPRLRGEEYHSLVDEFVHAVRRRFPHALLQWEDFRKGTAFALLDRYRKVLPSFNDDIQGTAAVALSGILAGSRLLGMPLVRHRVVILGAGAAGVGIARLLRDAFSRAGLAGEELRRAVAVLDSHGLVVEGEGPTEEYRRELAWPHALAQAHGLRPGDDLLAVVQALRPTVLIGVSGASGAFTPAVLAEMARHAERPLVFPLSNPTSQCEASPEDVLRWTDGRALVATGSPFPSVVQAGKTRRVGQGNNAFIFPGVGLGVLVAGAREVTDGMFRAAAERLADELRQEDLEAGALYPPMAALRRVTAHIAEAVVRQARRDGVARDRDDEDVGAKVAAAMWEPAYVRLVAGPS